MGKETIVSNLKEIGLPVFGTALEKRNRLWKHFGLNNDENSDPTKKVNILAELNQLEKKWQEIKQQKMFEDEPEQREQAWKMRADDIGQGKQPYEKMIAENWLDVSKSEPH